MAAKRKPRIVVATSRNLGRLASLRPDTIIHAYKHTDEKGAPPYYGPRDWDDVPRGDRISRYERGYIYYVKHVDDSPAESCGAGLNVATLKWVLNDMKFDKSHKICLVAFTAADIVCVPEGSSGEFRVRQLEVVKFLSKRKRG